MTETLLNKISKYSNDTIVTNAWLTGQTGEIVDLKGDCVFRFIDFIDDGELRLKHTTEESKLSCPIVATGLVGFWLHRKDDMGVKTIFEDYFKLRLQEYEKAHESDDDAWERDLKKEFTCRYHKLNEKKNIKVSEALFQYVTEKDKKKVMGISKNYLKFVRAKRKELYPPDYPANRIIEDTFLAAYHRGGAACECMEWMRTEYNLPYMAPHWHPNGKTEKEYLSGKWKEHHEVTIPEYVAEEFEDFDDGVLMYTNGGLMDEIDENLKKCSTYEDKVRYIISLLQPFKEFADAFYPKARIEQRKRSIIEHKKWIGEWEAMPDDAADKRTGRQIRPKDQIDACLKTIEEYQQDIIYWNHVQDDFYWFAQHGLGGGDYRTYPQPVNDEMCQYLGRWWSLMIHFSDSLAAVALTYGIKLMDVQEQCDVYLNWSVQNYDYVDHKFISSVEHAKRLLREIEQQDEPTEMEFKILNILRLHGKEIDPSIKDSKQIYDFEGLDLYTETEIAECSKQMEDKGWILCFIDHEGCPAYWHELKDNGRIALRDYLEKYPHGKNEKKDNEQKNNVETDKTEKNEKKKSSPGRPPKQVNTDMNYTLVYQPVKEETDENDKPIFLDDKERDERIILVDNALRNKYHWFDVTTPTYALKNLLSGKDVKCGIIWSDSVSNNAKTAFVKMLVDDKVCSYMEGCSGANDLVMSQFSIDAAYRKPKKADITVIHEIEMLLRPVLGDNLEDSIFKVDDNSSLSAQREVDKKNMGIQNRPKGKIL